MDVFTLTLVKRNPFYRTFLLYRKRMPKKVEIPLGNAKLLIEFNNSEQLKAELKGIDEIRRIIESELGASVSAPPLVREDLKDLCDSDGRFLVLKNPLKANNEKVMLTVYAYGTGATLEQIEHTTGIIDVSKKVLRNGNNRKYFVNLQRETYGLSPLGLEVVTTKIIPLLRKQGGSPAS
jgi:hypothetical protein